MANKIIDREFVIDYVNSLEELSLEKKEIITKLIVEAIKYHKNITIESLMLEKEIENSFDFDK